MGAPVLSDTRRVRSTGTLFALASGAAFGSMAIFGKLAYEENVSVGTLLVARFTFAAALFWAFVLIESRRGRVAAVGRTDARRGLALGAFGYAAQAGLFFLALTRIDASLLSLLLYTFPAMVTATAILLGRERADRRRFSALALTSVGLVLVLAGAGTGRLDLLGAALALGAAAVYTAYILTSQGVASRVSPYMLSAFVCTGAAVTLTLGTLALGELHPEDVTAEGWLWLATIAVVSTVAAIGFFFAGLRRVGPTAASILATVEPVVTVGLAVIVFSESLTAVQVVGALCVLASVFVLQARRLPGGRAAAAPAPGPH